MAETSSTLQTSDNNPSSPFQCSNSSIYNMSSSRDAPNPLRPYYRPPSVGIPADLPGTTSSGTHGLGPKNGSAASYASSARDMFSDIDYSDYLTESSPSVIQSIKQQLDNWTYRYMSVLLAQPFDVAKTILQVRSHALEDGLVSEEAELQPRHSNYRNSVHHDVGRACRNREHYANYLPGPL